MPSRYKDVSGWMNYDDDDVADDDDDDDVDDDENLLLPRWGETAEA